MRLKDTWLLLPALLYFVVVLQYSPNVPIIDDYDAILGFLLKFTHADGWHKFLLLFSQYGEHRILHSRLIYVCMYYLTGTVNFRTLIIIGNLQLVPILWVIVYLLRKYAGTYWWVPAFVFSLCIFDTNTYEAGSMAMSAIQNFGVPMLFMLALYSYDRGGVWMGVVLTFLLVMSGGNGMIGALFICLAQYWQRRKMIIAGAACILFTGAYFIGYIPTPPVAHNYGAGIFHFINMVGDYYSLTYNMFFGIVSLIVLAIYVPRRINSKDLPFLALLAWQMSSLAAAAFIRISAGLATDRTSRYLLMPQLIAACTYLLFFSSHKPPLRWGVPVLYAAVLTIIYSWNVQYGKAGFERVEGRALNGWYKAPKYPGYYYSPGDSTPHAIRIADSACKENIYCIGDFR